MAYPSDNKPRRRLQAVPDQRQMIRRRAASPGQMPKPGMGLMGPPVQDGGIPQRRLPQGNAFGLRRNLGMPTLDGRPNPASSPGFQGGPVGGGNFNPTQPEPPGGTWPGPNYEGGGRPGKDPNQWVTDEPDPEAEHSPLEHQRYWASKGWLLDPKVNKFVYVGNKALEQYLTPGNNFDGNGGPGGDQQRRMNAGPGPVIQGQNGGGDMLGVGASQGGASSSPLGTTGTGGAGPGADPYASTGNGAGGGGAGGGGGNGLPPIGTDGIPTGMPLDSIFEAQRRAYSDQLARTLGLIGPQREQIGAQEALQSARMNTNEGVEQRRMLESLAGRGAFGGGIQVRDQGLLSTDYLRQRQDLAQGSAQGYAGLAQQESDAQSMYSSQLMEALLQLAQRQAQSQYAVTPNS
jgi:hypothetical protein